MKTINDRRDLRPDAQAIDRIVIETIPRYKTSGLSGDEWRISANISFYRKGELVHVDSCSNIEYATRLLDSKLIALIDEGYGYYAGVGDTCDQEGCHNKATVLAKKKFDYCREGHKSENRSTAYRLFCECHKNRGDCGLDDANINYDFIEWINR